MVILGAIASGLIALVCGLLLWHARILLRIEHRLTVVEVTLETSNRST